jgi:HK97 family phage prohead protease
VSVIIVDVDGTLDLNGNPNEPLIAALNRKVSNGDRVVVVSSRQESRLRETKFFLDDAGLGYSEIYLSDFPEGPNAGNAFKSYKVFKLIEDGYEIDEAIDNDAEIRRIFRGMGIDAFTAEEYLADNSRSTEGRAIDPNGYEPTAAMREEAERGLEWRREFNRGGTLVGVARARDIAAGKRLPADTVLRMRSYFARHEVDKEAQGFRPGEDGFPSAGRIAWALWGGDPAQAWVESIIETFSEEKSTSKTGEIMGIEFRTATANLRAVDPEGMTFEGYASLFDSPSGEGVEPEIVKKGAFARSLAAAKRGEWDVRAYQDHDPKLLLGTTKSGTLELEENEKGLLARIRLNPNITWHRDLAELVRTMHSSLGMSFGFFNTRANTINDQGVRELRDVKLVEVSALTGLQPYYPGTLSLVAVRSLADKAGVDTSELRDALSAMLAGELRGDHAKAITAALEVSLRDVEGVPTKFPGDVAKPVEKPVEKIEEPIVEDAKEPEEKRSVAEDLGIVVADLAQAVAAADAGVATAEQLALIVTAAKGVIDEAAAEPVELELVPGETAPSEEMPDEHEGNKIKVEIEVTVPRSIREKELELLRLSRKI